MQLVSPEGSAHRGDVVSTLIVMFAEAACSQHALVLTGIKGREAVVAFSRAVEEVLTEARGRIKEPAVLEWPHSFTAVLWFWYQTCLK